MAKKKVTIKKDASGKKLGETEVIETDEAEEEEEEGGADLFGGDVMAEVSANLGKGSEPEIEFKLYQIHEGKPPEYLRDLTKAECSEAFIQAHYPQGGAFMIRGRNILTHEERAWNIQIRGASGFGSIPLALGSGTDSTTALISLMIAQMNNNQQLMMESMRVQQAASDKKTETIINALAAIAAPLIPALMNKKDPDKEMFDTMLKVMQAAKGGDSEALGLILDFARSAASEVAKVINPAGAATDNPVVAAIQTFAPILTNLFGGIMNRFPTQGFPHSPSTPPPPTARPNGGAQSLHAVVPPTGGAAPSASVGGAATTPKLNFKQLFERIVLPDLTRVARMSKLDQQADGVVWVEYSPSSFAETFKFEILKSYGLAEPQLKEELLTAFPSFNVFSDLYQGLFTGPDGEKLEQWFYDFYVEIGGPELPEPGTTTTAVDGASDIIT